MIEDTQRETTPDTALSVIIVNRNTADLLVKCIDHVFGSRVTQRPEVIVVDNGSDDDSVEAVKSAYPEVLVIEAGRNLGFSSANNRALSAAKGKYLLLVNTDAMLHQDCAPRLMASMDQDPAVGMAGPQLFNEDGTRQTSYEAVPTLATETLNRSLLKRLFPGRFPGKKRILTDPEPVEALIGAVMMIRREAVDQVGGFDENYFFFLEETDLAVRMRNRGWKVMHCPDAGAVHLQGATAKTYQAAARIEFYRSRYFFFNKHYGAAASTILKAAMIANLTLNVLALGLGTVATLGRAAEVRSQFKVRSELWRWHLQGCPPGPGLPR